MEEGKGGREEKDRYVEHVVDDMSNAVVALKREKRNAKANLTRLLNQVVALLSEEKHDKKKVVELMERIERLREQTMKILEELE